jgi:hypothetical protein
MGLFLAMSGIVGASKEDVESALRSFVQDRKGSLRQESRSAGAENTLILFGDGLRCSVVYPWQFLEWDEASRHLSAELAVPVFSFHIHDEDLWMFLLFDKGRLVTQFNPLPEYWDDDTFGGRAGVVARRCSKHCCPCFRHNRRFNSTVLAALGSR